MQNNPSPANAIIEYQGIFSVFGGINMKLTRTLTALLALLLPVGNLTACASPPEDPTQAGPLLTPGDLCPRASGEQPIYQSTEEERNAAVYEYRKEGDKANKYRRVIYTARREGVTYRITELYEAPRTARASPPPPKRSTSSMRATAMTTGYSSPTSAPSGLRWNGSPPSVFPTHRDPRLPSLPLRRELFIFLVIPPKISQPS